MKTEAIDAGKQKGLSYAWLFLVIGCLAAGLTYWHSRNAVERELASRFNLRASEARHMLEREVARYTQVLRGLRAQFAVHPNLSDDSFRQHAEVISRESRLPGVLAVGFTRRFAREGTFTVRAESAKAGSFSPRLPTRARPAAAETDVVHYNEPVANIADVSLGERDGALEGRASIERARDAGDWSTSGRIWLATAPDASGGVIFFLPVYRTGATPATIEQRRQQFAGTVLLAIRIEEMLREVFGRKLLDDLDIQVFDARQGEQSDGTRSTRNLIFDSGSDRRTKSLRVGAVASPFSQSFNINMGDGEWQMDVAALPALASQSQQWLPPIAALTVVLLSLLAFYFTRAVELSRRSLHAHARRIEEVLEDKEMQLTRIVESIDAVLWRLEMPAGKLTYISAAAARMSGRPVAAYYQEPFHWMKSIHPDDRDQVRAVSESIRATGHETVEYRIVRDNGDVRWIRCDAYYAPGAETDVWFIDGIENDMTNQRLLQVSLQRSNRALRAIHECEEAIASIDDEARLLQQICDVAVQVGYRTAWAGIFKNEGSLQIAPSGLAGEHRGYLTCIRSALEAGELDQFPTILEAIQLRRPSVANNFDSETASVYLRVEATARGLRSKVTLPLFHEQAMIGVLNVYAAEPDAFDVEGVGLLMDMAQSLAVAIQTLRHRSGRRLAEATARLRERAIEASANAIIIASAQAPDYPIEYVNSAFEQMTGYTAAEVIGHSARILYGAESEQPGIAELRALLREKIEGHAVVRNFRKDGTAFWSDVYLAPVRNDEGAVTHFVAAKYDITATKNYEAELEFQAGHDALTGLPNANLLRDRLTQAIAFAARYGHQIWVVFVNLDRFKFVNETLGFHAGDLLLKKIADRLQSAVRETDTVGRLNGDEFVVILPEGGDDIAASAAVRRLMQAVAHPLLIEHHEFLPTCSVGIAVYPTDGNEADTLVKHAHIAMYRAKEGGNSSLQAYTPGMNERIIERQRLESDLRSALEREEFELYYQPQVELRTGRTIGMEALLRWQHPQLGTVMPMRFIGLAEETGLIVPIGAWVLRTACRQVKEWENAGLGQLRVAVNLSARQFGHADLVQSIAETLEQTGLRPQSLDLELTESVVMADVEQAVHVLGGLKALGVHLSIDDFGTGYSSLAYLKRFPIDMLKIDQSFVRDIVTNPDDAAIVKSVISLAHSLRLQVIAEGVETDTQLAYLRRHACDHIQGYLVSRPVPAEAFRQLLECAPALPLAPGDTAPPGQTLLVIDDETHVTSALYRLLRKDGFHILRANSAIDAFEQLALHPVQVVLCDQRMLTMSGKEFLSKVRDLYPDTIRIVLSGYPDLQSVIDAINCGAIYRFLTKPWEDEVLRDNIREAFRHYWLLHRKRHDDFSAAADAEVSAALPIRTLAGANLLPKGRAEGHGGHINTL